jgi:hypothetical protein
MKFIFLLVMIVFGDVRAASDTDRDSSPETRIFRVLSRPHLERALAQPLDAESGVHSDPGAETSLSHYLFPLEASDSPSSSNSAFHLDSDHEKCAISDHDLVHIGKLTALIANKIYGSSDFQKNVYSVLDLHQFRFDPAQGKTLGDMLDGLLQRQMTLRIDVNAHTLTFEHMRDERQRQKGCLERLSEDIETLRGRIGQQDEHIKDICTAIGDLQRCLGGFQKEMRTLVDFMVIRQSLHDQQAFSRSSIPSKEKAE